MMAEPDGMLEWLGAQFDADEAAALIAQADGSGQWAAGGTWWLEGVEHAVVKDQDGREVAFSHEGFAPHVARNDPASVLARVAAHRAILAEHTGSRSYVYTDDGTPACDVCGDGTVRWPCPTVRHLATAYAARAGFDPTWRPQ